MRLYMLDWIYRAWFSAVVTTLSLVCEPILCDDFPERCNSPPDTLCTREKIMCEAVKVISGFSPTHDMYLQDVEEDKDMF